ncbi:serine protease 27-like [Brachionus plicatilis]|uniref:Serine protease 27-like n=1 Tax=Brachionus plicatilis TaxID=10195 RepID=A0A3M7PXK9_BRAPC|nr:serine protease 27-like [Brachionus plicatilis]
MTLLFNLLSLVIVGKVFSSCGSKSLRIINGEVAAVWPWMVSFQSVSQNRHFCGGSLITPQFVLSAAHCFEHNKTFFMIAGANNLNDPNLIIHEVSSVTLHENYNSTSLENDIALIKLTEEITDSSKVSPICLPSHTDESLIINQKVIISGW